MKNEVKIFVSIMIFLFISEFTIDLMSLTDYEYFIGTKYSEDSVSFTAFIQLLISIWAISILYRIDNK